MALIKKCETDLVNSIKATTLVQTDEEGMQYAKVTFSSSVGNLGSKTLTPMQPTATDLYYKVGDQSLSISILSFRAAFGFESGQVKASGTGTDAGGKNPASFDRQICSWEL